MGWKLSEATKIIKVQDASGANTTDVTSDGVDMAGYEGVIFVSSYGTAAADNLPHAEQGLTSGGSYDDLASTEVGVSTSDEDVYLEIVRPGDRFVRTVWERGTSSTLGDIWAHVFGARNLPVDNTTAGTMHGESHVTPAEGTI